MNVLFSFNKNEELFKSESNVLKPEKFDTEILLSCIIKTLDWPIAVNWNFYGNQSRRKTILKLNQLYSAKTPILYRIQTVD